MTPSIRPLVGLPTPTATPCEASLARGAAVSDGSRSLVHPAALLAIALAVPAAWLAYGQSPAQMACAERLARPTWMDLAMLLAWAPIAEEVALRLGVQQPLRGWFARHTRLSPRGATVASILVAALAFAALHLTSGPGPWTARLAVWLVPGLALAACHALDGRLGRTVVLHSWFNACALLACARAL